VLEKKTLTSTSNAREAAFLALYNYKKEDIFLEETLSFWKSSTNPSLQDFHLAKEIAYGSCRMALALDYLGAKLSHKGKLQISLKEKMICHMALYQHFFLSQIPLHAIGKEMGNLANKYTNPHYASFLNALIRRLEASPPSLPTEQTLTAISTYYSYPPFFVNKLMEQLGIEKAKECMEIQNSASPLMFRIRPSEAPFLPQEGIKLLTSTVTPIGICKDKSLLPLIFSSPLFYVQNATQITLLDALIQNAPFQPQTILDLCAAPGGKTIGIYDSYKHATFYVNDISEKKIGILKENLKKYAIHAHVTQMAGEEYVSNQLFDLIVIDAPCSNSGVLNKRPEARFRLTPEALETQKQLQLSLIKKAYSLLSEQGMIWYMTCSILEEENSALLEHVQKILPLKVLFSSQILPTKEGFDGGFAAILKNDNVVMRVND
jgi:16S rRNA (cytosine967-C5)-methyltransferase